MISLGSISCKYVLVVPRSVRPSWRWMMLIATPSWAARPHARDGTDGERTAAARRSGNSDGPPRCAEAAKSLIAAKRKIVVLVRAENGSRSAPKLSSPPKEAIYVGKGQCVRPFVDVSWLSSPISDPKPRKH